MILTVDQFTEGRPLDKVFITSDFHLSHFNIIKYTKRPFSNIEEMNEFYLSKMDSLPEGSLIWNLGDFSFNREPSFLKETLNRLNKNNKTNRLILGNHEKAKESSLIDFYKSVGFDTVLEGPVLVGTYLFSHCPYYLKGTEGVVNIHGHTHQNNVHPNYFRSEFYEGYGKGLKVDSRLYFNASVDKQPFISLEDLQKLYG